MKNEIPTDVLTAMAEMTVELRGIKLALRSLESSAKQINENLRQIDINLTDINYHGIGTSGLS